MASEIQKYLSQQVYKLKLYTIEIQNLLKTKMYNSKLFDNLSNVNLQIQEKRRKNDMNGMWGAPIEILNQLGIGNLMGNNGWGQQGQQGGWGNEGFMNNMIGEGMGQLGLEMALFSNQGLWGNNLDGQDWVRQQEKRQRYALVGAGNNKTNFGMGDISDVLRKQITFLEPSPAQRKIQQLKRLGKPFYDDRFPPNKTSLCGQYGNISQWSQIQWKKVSQVLSNPLIFRDKVEPNDIKQGYLGDCYFLAGLAALAERPDRIFNLFLVRQANSVKYYSVKMLYKGKWMTIDMDEHVPFLHGKPAFSDSVGNQLWVILLQKAWAKMYTSYKRIQAGYPEEPLHDLTGAPIKNMVLKDPSFNKQAEWQYLMMASQREYSMVASSRPGSDRNKSQTGIVQGHAYTFLNATTLNFNGRQQRIVQLRNPWGKGQFKGRWSDVDSNWKQIPPQQLQRIGFSNNPNDGIFFMTYDDFITEFRALTIAQINDNASYVYKSFKDRKMEGGFFKIQILKSGYYSFHVDKTPERSFEDRIQEQYQYPQAKLQLGVMTGSGCQKLQTFTSGKRTLFKGFQLNPGVHVAYVKISYDGRFQKEYDVNLAVYAEYACDVQLAPRQLAVALSGNPNVKWNPAEHQQQAGEWNNLSNSTYNPGDSGWGNYPNNNNTNINSGWGNQGGNNGWGNNTGGGGNGGWGNQGSNNGGWGNTGGNTGGNNDGWGNYFQAKGNNNSGWGNNTGNNDGWGDTFHKKGSDNGWGNTNNTGWQNTATNNNNNSGWGNTFETNPNTQGNNGWGNQPTAGKGPNSSWGPGW